MKLARRNPAATGPGVPAGTVVGLRTRRALVAAMEQQMWFFGCDAACADGNLLVRYGFEKQPLDLPRGKSSRYCFHWHPEARGESACVHLHGWCAGLHLGDMESGGFLYTRSGNRLGWYRGATAPLPGEYDDFPESRRAFRLVGRQPEPGFCRTAGWFVRWLIEYEGWIAQVCGPNYRRRCHERCPVPWLPPRESLAWLSGYGAAVARCTGAGILSN